MELKLLKVLRCETFHTKKMAPNIPDSDELTPRQPAKELEANNNNENNAENSVEGGEEGGESSKKVQHFIPATDTVLEICCLKLSMI